MALNPLLLGMGQGWRYAILGRGLSRGYETPGRVGLIVLRTKEGKRLHMESPSCVQSTLSTFLPGLLYPRHHPLFPLVSPCLQPMFNGLSTALQRPPNVSETALRRTILARSGGGYASAPATRSPICAQDTVGTCGPSAMSAVRMPRSNTHSTAVSMARAAGSAPSE